MDFLAALENLEKMEKLHPPADGVPARLGWALHSETLKEHLIWGGTNTAWHTNAPDAHETHSWTGWTDKTSFFKNAKGKELVFESFPGLLMKHKKGNLYLGLATVIHENETHGLYVKYGPTTGPVWWLRPWPMFTPDRFEPIGRIWQWPMKEN